jgi:hypothetical protein
MACTDTATVLMVIPVDDVMTAVLDAPGPAVILQHLGGAGEAWCFAGNPIGDILGWLAAFFVDRDLLHPEGLLDMGEVQVVIERGGDSDVSDFEAAMLGAVQGGVIGFAVELVKIVGGLLKPVFFDWL